MTSSWKDAEAPQNTAVHKIKKLFDFSPVALGELKTWFEQNPPKIPVGQIQGFDQFQLQVTPDVVTAESTLSTTYTDLATVGPSLANLPNGKYLFVYSFAGSNGGGGTANHYMNIKVNSTLPGNDNDAARVTTGQIGVTSIGWSVQTLTAGANTVTAVYRVDGSATGTPNFQIRRLFGLRVANT